MPVVLLVRHGQASFGAENYDELSDTGRRQSHVVGAELRRRPLRDPVVVHGTLVRQRDTASIAMPRVQPNADARWNEYDHLELLKRYVRPVDDAEPPTSSREVQGLLDAALLAWVEHGDEGGWPAFAGGARAALQEVLDGLPSGRDAVVFTSGGVIAALCSELVGGAANTVVALNRTAINGAITKLVVGRSGISLASYNEHAHLDAEALVTYR